MTTSTHPPTFRHVTQNVQGTDPFKTVEQTIRTAAEHADVLNLCEVPSTAVVRAALDPKVWHWRQRGEIVIAWRTHLFWSHGWDSYQVNGGQLHITPSRFIVTVDLVPHGYGRDWEFTDEATHVVHHIETAGEPMRYRGRERWTFRYQAARARRHFKMLAQVLVKDTNRTHRAIGSGDLNVDLYADRHRRYVPFPYHQLVDNAHARIAHAPGYTEGRRMIDWVWSKGKLQVTDARKGPRTASDHAMVLCNVTLAK